MLKYIDDLDFNHLIQSLKGIISNIGSNCNQSIQDIIKKVEEAFSEFTKLKKAVDESIIVGITDQSGRIIYVNKKFTEISGYRKEEILGKTHRIVNSGFHEKRFFLDMWKTIRKGEIWEGNIRNQAKDGSYYWVKTSIVPICDDNNKPYMYISLRTDITKWKQQEEALLNALENDFNLVVSSMNNLVFKVTKNEAGEMVYQFGEGKLAYKLGARTQDIENKKVTDIYEEEKAKEIIKYYEEAFKGKSITYSHSLSGYQLITTLSPIYENGQVVSIIGSSNDMTELHEANKKIEYLAYYDTLTDLPNRKSLIADLHKYIQGNRSFALLFLDVNRYRYITESLGHTFADELIKNVAERLKEKIGANQTIYRFSENEFIILYLDEINKEIIFKYSRHLLNIFKEKFYLKRYLDIYMTGTIGISIYPEHGSDIEELILHADSAVSAAKKLGKNAYKIYDQAMDKEIQKQMQIEFYLQTAIQNKELELHYQPKLDLNTNEINSMEALLRWRHPVLGNVPPNIFIPIAEDTGLIWDLDEWVLEEACRQNLIWLEKFSKKLRVAVNISALHFSHPDFVNMVEHVLERTGMDPAYLELEITETSVINNPEECKANVSKLRDMGVTVSIDDFGTGYSSLNYLRMISINSLKIDRSYIRQMNEHKEDWAIVKTIIQLAHELNLKVIAEGVEEEYDLKSLKEIGCDEIQGYFISKPLPPREFEQLLVHN